MCKFDDLASEFGRLVLRMRRLFDSRLANSGVSLARTKVLMFVEKEGPVRATDIAVCFGQAPRTVTEALDALERDSLIRREPDAQDRRVKRVSVTDEGRRALAETEPLRLKLIDQIFGVLDDEERAQLEKIVVKLTKAVEAEEGAISR